LAYITGFDTQQHFPDDTLRVERYEPGKVYNVCYFDNEQGYYYMKRFALEQTDKAQYFLDEDGSWLSSSIIVNSWTVVLNNDIL
jgi:topoisomerase-4 subunit A